MADATTNTFPTTQRRARKRIKSSAVVMTLYLLFLLLPIYWLLNMSLKTNEEILSGFSMWPDNLTFANYVTIFTDPSWYSGYINSITYVVMNTAISITVALPAAYAFSRYRFLGDKHLFFWLLTNRRSSRCRSFSCTARSGCSTRTSPWPWRTACSTCRWRYGFWKASCPACRKRSTRRPTSTVTASPASSPESSCH